MQFIQFEGQATQLFWVVAMADAVPEGQLDMHVLLTRYNEEEQVKH